MPLEPDSIPLIHRRNVLAGFAGIAAGLPVLNALAQDATPAPDAELLFVQVAESGTAEPVEGETDRYTVTLANGSGQTLYFSDRPERLAGILSTQDFLQTTDMVAGRPNAALVFRPDQSADDSQSKLVVLELSGAGFDPATSSITYEVRLLDIASAGTHPVGDPALALDSIPAAFGQATLFIDPYQDRVARSTLRVVVNLIQEN